MLKLMYIYKKSAEPKSCAFIVVMYMITTSDQQQPMPYQLRYL